jgi:hypothetical protein
MLADVIRRIAHPARLHAVRHVAGLIKKTRDWFSRCAGFPTRFFHLPFACPVRCKASNRGHPEPRNINRDKLREGSHLFIVTLNLFQGLRTSL